MAKRAAFVHNPCSWMALCLVLLGCANPVAVRVTLKSCFPKNAQASTDSSAGNESSLNIVGGQLASNSDDMEKSTIGLQVFSPLAEDPKRAMVGTCTTVVAASNILLTAAHCFNPPKDDNNKLIPVLPSQAFVSTSLTLGGLKPSQMIKVAKWMQHPLYNGTFHDIAIVQLEKPLPPEFKPAAFEIDISKLVPATPVVLIGYGITSDALKDSGTKRRTESFLDKLINPTNFPKTKIENQIRVLDTSGQARGACHGDSGGPGFVKQTSKVFGLVQGVNLTVQSMLTCSMGDANYTLVSPYKDWIEQNSGITLLTSSPMAMASVPSSSSVSSVEPSSMAPALDGSKTSSVAVNGNAAGQQIGNTPGQQIGNTPGQQIGNTPGQQIGNASGQQIGNTSGQQIGNITAASSQNVAVQSSDANSKTATTQSVCAY